MKQITRGEGICAGFVSLNPNTVFIMSIYLQGIELLFKRRSFGEGDAQAVGPKKAPGHDVCTTTPDLKKQREANEEEYPYAQAKQIPFIRDRWSEDKRKRKKENKLMI